MADIWTNLNTFTIEANDVGTAGGDTVTYGTLAQQVQKQSNPVHLEAKNREVLEDIVLINNATMRGQGSPIPGTQICYRKSNADDSSYYDEVLTPKEGEVYAISVLNWELKNAGSLSWYIRPTSGGGTERVRVSNMTGVGPDLGLELPPQLYLAYPNVLDVYVASPTGSNIYTYIAIRVR